MSDFTNTPLSNLLSDRLSYGIVQPGKNVDGGIPALRVTDAFNNSSNEIKCVDPKISQKHKHTILRGDELLISVVGTPGETCFVKPEWIGYNVVRAIAVARFKDQGIRDYVHYYLEKAKKVGAWNGVLNETVQPTLNIGDLLQIDIRLPHPELRRKIVAQLKTLDDKIALNRRTNQTLEAMAQALFKSWFVDFDPVIDNALDAGHALPDALATRVARRKAVRASGKYAPLAAEVRALFPASFEWSEALGKFVPRGWGVKTLKDKVKMRSGSRPTLISEGKYPAYGSNGKIGSSNEYLVEDCILVGRVGSYCGSLIRISEKSMVSDNAIILEATNSNHHEFIFWHLSRLDLNSMQTGSGQPLLNQSIIGSIAIVEPEEEIGLLFHQHINKFRKTINLNLAESTTLSTLRDVLLGELIG